MFEENVEKLSDIIPKDNLTEELEDILGNVTLVIDTGFYIEAYIQPEGIRRGDWEQGFTLLRYIDKECTYGELLSIFHTGSIREGTMTLSVIPDSDSFFQKERVQSLPISTELDYVREHIA